MSWLTEQLRDTTTWAGEWKLKATNLNVVGVEWWRLAIYRFVTKRLRQIDFATGSRPIIIGWLGELLKAVLKICSSLSKSRSPAWKCIFVYGIFVLFKVVSVLYFFSARRTEISTRKRKSRVHFSCDVGPGKLRARRLSLRSHNFLWMWMIFQEEVLRVLLECWGWRRRSFDPVSMQEKNNLNQFLSAVWEMKKQKIIRIGSWDRALLLA